MLILIGPSKYREKNKKEDTVRIKLSPRAEIVDADRQVMSKQGRRVKMQESPTCESDRKREHFFLTVETPRSLAWANHLLVQAPSFFFSQSSTQAGPERECQPSLDPAKGNSLMIRRPIIPSRGAANLTCPQDMGRPAEWQRVDATWAVDMVSVCDPHARPAHPGSPGTAGGRARCPGAGEGVSLLTPPRSTPYAF